jgi:glucose-6-phosphate 1-dehydrogenase
MLDNKHNVPTIFVILGATGDLMARKITPSLYQLYCQNKLPKLIKIIGFSRRDISDQDFREYIKELVIEQAKSPAESSLIDEFARLFSYHQGDFTQKESYQDLAKKLGYIDNEWKTCANKLFHLAVPPNFYKDILGFLESTGLTIPCGGDLGWTRVLVEKPFGNDLETAQELDMLLGKLFQEEQIYRIDHYLAKEMLQGIINFRFSNNLFESSWNNKMIEKIEIKFLEELKVGRRGVFYDQIGALRDVGQNHILQMLAIITMDRPTDTSSVALREKREEILDLIHKLSPTEIKNNTLRAQYEGYNSDPNIKDNSQTETYFKLKTTIDSPRWSNVPVYLEAGKALKETDKQIIVTFKHVRPCLCPPGIHYQNKVVFSFEPEESIKIEFWTKKPGLDKEQVKREFEFFVYKEDETEKTKAYSKLLLDCIEGDQTLFVSTKEVKAMWEFIDPIINSWQKNEPPLKTYRPNSNEIIEEFKEKQVTLTAQQMTIGMVGLGKMGGAIAQQLLEKDFKIIGYNRTQAVTQEYAQLGLIPTNSLKELVSLLPKPRIIWLMVPAGKPVEEMIFGDNGLINYLEEDDILVDAGNSYYKDSISLANKLKDHGIKFMDVGTSGGPGGARNGACLMIGGDRKTFEYLQTLFKAIALPDGFQFFDGAGAGHFVKMVHNGIEYGMMQAIGEGFAIMKKSDYNLDLLKVASLYNNGSVIESKLIEWLGNGLLSHGQDLEDVTSTVAHTGEGSWTIKAAQELNVESPVISDSLQFRIDSKNNPSYIGKILSVLREQFGGHSSK